MEKKIKKLNSEAIDNSIKSSNINSANKIIKEIFNNKYLYLDAKKMFEPNYFHCTLKEKFYSNGGDEFGVYDETEYSKLLEVPVKYINEVIDSSPEFILWLHERRSIDEEMDILVSIASRKLVNGMNGSSTKDQAQALNALSKFSTLVKPEKKEDPFDSHIDGIMELDSLKAELEKLGFKKDDEIMFDVLEKEEDDDTQS